MNEVKKPAAKVAEKPEPKASNEQLAKEIVIKVSHELHRRIGVGPIWRQLNDARKQEILDKWQHDITELLKEQR